MPADMLVLEDGLAGGRRQLRLRIGSIAVRVTEVPGPSLSDQEWQDVLLARRTYTTMWGADPAMMANDPQDGRENGVYDTRHYLAWVRDGVDEGVHTADGPRPGKLVTMRKVRLVGTRLAAAQRADPFDLLPVDIQFWRARTSAGDVPLWEVLKEYARRLAPADEWADFRIATVGRTGTFPPGERRTVERQREHTALGFAAIGLLAAHDDPSLFWVCTLCPEFRDRVLGITDRGRYVAPRFPPTAQVLGLAAEALYMDDDLAVVQACKVGAPGYFIHTEDAAQVLAQLLDRQQVTIADLGAAFTDPLIAEARWQGAAAHLEQLARLISARDHPGLARLLTQPRLFKYLSPLLAGDEPLSRMSSVEFRTRLLCDTRDRPFSAAVRPGQWTASVRAVLRAAAAKYGNGRPPVRMVRNRRRAPQVTRST